MLTSLVVQGYQMAKNLQSKLSPSDSVILFDINKTAMNELAKDIRTSQPEGAVIELAENVVEVARNAVSLPSTLHPTFPLTIALFYDEYVLSMI